jgi:hypothetical protein
MQTLNSRQQEMSASAPQGGEDLQRPVACESLLLQTFLLILQSTCNRSINPAHHTTPPCSPGAHCCHGDAPRPHQPTWCNPGIRGLLTAGALVTPLPAGTRSLMPKKADEATELPDVCGTEPVCMVCASANSWHLTCWKNKQVT